jgi:hypothetical protein
MIKFGSRCAEIIGTLALNSRQNIALPSDICPSVIEAFQSLGVSYFFYPILRKWNNEDEYDFKKCASDNIILVSDLFNFRTINFKQLSGCSIFLDLAHCSLQTAHWYLKKFPEFGVKVLYVFISFGRGKYYRFGGGGVGFSPNDISKLDIEYPFEYGVDGLPPEILADGLFNAHSTRIIVPSRLFEPSKIKSMRSSGIDISDSLGDHLYNRPFSEYIVWKPRQQKSSK